MDEKVSNTLRFNFYPCYERFCRRCIDGSCTDKETYEKCDFGADKVAERARKRAMERKESDRCGNCFWFDGEEGDGTQFCDEKQRQVSENGYCPMHKRRIGENESRG